jgi:hypothetical protein
LGYAGGDPHFQTLDNLEYTFNGYGKFIYSRANDNSYEVQVNTDVLNNLNGSSTISGTIFTGFAMRTNQTSIFQINIGDSSSTDPYMLLVVDGKTIEEFSRNFQYSQDYPCKDDSSLTCATVVQDDTNGAQVLFSNGLVLSLKISRVNVNDAQTLSWLTCNMALSDEAYINNVNGLMGNNNGDENDDLESRFDGSRPTNMNSERSIYQIANTCKFFSWKKSQAFNFLSIHNYF